MRKIGWIAAALLVLAGAGYAARQKYWIYLPGVLAEWRDPVADNRTVTWAQGPAAPPAGEAPPNIVLIVADDLGMNDISLYGGGIVPTPNIDSIAKSGVSFANGYAANATCSPSRAALMTGRYPTRFGFEFTSVPGGFARAVSHNTGRLPHPLIYHEELDRDILPYAQQGVPASEVTIAETLKGRGYHTMQIGKWHLGEAPALRPTGQGFDESLALLAGADLFLPRDDPQGVEAKLPWDPIDKFLWANAPYAVNWGAGKRFHPKGHLTDYWTDNAVAAIEANRNRPFFLYLAYNAPHTPLQALKADYDALPQIGDHTQRVYGAMIRQLDRRIGNVLAKLEATGIAQNTLVIFTSDNGGAWYTGIPGHNRPYRGWKATFFEGGIHVPLLMRWPGEIAPGTVRADMGGHLDMFATIAAAAGAALPGDRTMDSIDLLASTSRTRTRMFWRSGNYRAARDGDWKLQVTKRPARVRLYNLAADPTEQRDLSAAQPRRTTAMRALIEAHNRGMARPQWPGLVEAPVRIDVPLTAPWARDQDYVYWTN